MEKVLENNLRNRNIKDAARLYAIAFERKFIKLVGDTDVMTKLLSKIINPNRAIAAYNSDGKLLGIAGYRYKNEMLINIRKDAFIEQFGLLKGNIKYILVKALYKRNADDNLQLLMDGIAVDENFRGHGIGKLLFDKLEEFAKTNNLTSIKLDVIDENPRAKKLYEKIGFKAVKYKKMNFVISKLIGVSGVTTMIKEIK